jgi:integrase
MGQHQHLKRRQSGIYVVRLIVPPRLRAATGQREVQRSTGCRDLLLAKVVAAEMAAHWHAKMAALRHMDLHKLKAGSIDLIGDGTLPLADAAVLLGATPLDLAERLARRHARFYVQATGWDGWVLDDIHGLYHEYDEVGEVTVIDVTESALELNGQRRQRTGQLELLLGEDAVAIARTAHPYPVCLFLIPPSRSIGYVVPLPGSPITVDDLLVRRRDVEALRTVLRDSLPQDLVSSLINAQPKPAAATVSQDSIAKAKYGDRLLSDLTAAYLTAKANEWSKDEQRRQAASREALLELSGNPKLHDVDRETLHDAAAKLKLVPEQRHRFRKALGDRGHSWIALIEHAETHGLPRMSPGSVERIMDDIGSVFRWGHVRGWLRENPAVALGSELFRSMGGVRKAQDQKRSRFSDADLVLIFGAVWFNNGVGNKTALGIYFSYRPYYYWLPLLALLVGGRLNELAQLHLDDICQDENGDWIVDFNLNQADKIDVDEGDSDEDSTDVDKSLKSIAAHRAVPIHRSLIELGFIQYVDALRKNGHHRLFPELTFDAIKGYGKQAGKWFNDRYLGRGLKIERNGMKTFHSLRHNFGTLLERAGVPDKATKQLMGHTLADRAKGGATPGYQKRRDAVELRPYIMLLSPNLPAIAIFNIDEGLVAIRDALHLKESHVPRPAATPSGDQG